MELGFDREYAQYYANFFSSTAGGAYESSEINYYEDVSVGNLIAISKALYFDYAILVLIGHGATQGNSQLFKLNEDEIIKPGQIELNTRKQLTIIESCRTEIDGIFTVDLNDKIPKFAKGGIVRAQLTRQKVRALYDKIIDVAADGIQVCFACSNGQEAKNYYFSLVMMQSAFQWHLDPSYHVEALFVSQLFQDVSEEVNSLSTDKTGESQDPQLLGNSDFPFVISKF